MSTSKAIVHQSALPSQEKLPSHLAARWQRALAIFRSGWIEPHLSRDGGFIVRGPESKETYSAWPRLLTEGTPRCTCGDRSGRSQHGACKHILAAELEQMGYAMRRALEELMGRVYVRHYPITTGRAILADGRLYLAFQHPSPVWWELHQVGRCPMCDHTCLSRPLSGGLVRYPDIAHRCHDEESALPALVADVARVHEQLQNDGRPWPGATIRAEEDLHALTTLAALRMAMPRQRAATVTPTPTRQAVR